MTIPSVGMSAVALVKSARASGDKSGGVAFSRTDIDRAVARRHSAHDLGAASARARRPGEVDELSAIDGIADDLGEIRVARPVRS